MLCCINFLITNHAPAAKTRFAQNLNCEYILSMYILSCTCISFGSLPNAIPICHSPGKPPHTHPKQSLHLNVWCRHRIHVVLALLFFSVQASWSPTPRLILGEYLAPWEPLIQLSYAKTFCIPEIFLELVHCPCQKASYIHFSVVLWKRWVWEHKRHKQNNPMSGSEETKCIKLWKSLPWCGQDAKCSSTMSSIR